jgi:surfeit locus 1 family protein
VSARSWIPLLLAAIIAVVCVRLGLWQLDRLGQRKVRNATIEAGFRAPPISAESAVASGTRAPRYQRVQASGRWNYDRERVVTGRTRSGSPGVHIVTPMTLDDGKTEILVNRGWVYSPDARSVDLTRWHEGERGDVLGYVDELPPSVRADAMGPYVVALADSTAATAAPANRPPRLSAPPFGDEGPHLTYAVQWFSFAAIALIGTPLVVRRPRRRRE